MIKLQCVSIGPVKGREMRLYPAGCRASPAALGNACGGKGIRDRLLQQSRPFLGEGNQGLPLLLAHLAERGAFCLKQRGNDPLGCPLR